MYLDGPTPASGTKLTLAGAEAGHVTSVAALPLVQGNRIFAMGMIRAEAELRSLPLAYSVGETTGTARILDSPPVLSMER